MRDAEPHSFQPESDIENLTVQACRAAEQGDWDQVERCVNRRGALLEGTAVPPVSSARLVALDMRIRASAMAARAALETLLVDLGQTRRNLRQLQQRTMGPQPERSRFMNVKA